MVIDWRYKTKFTEILVIKYLILQSRFGTDYSSAQLMSVVSNAGGLGDYEAYSLSPVRIPDVNK
jgi:nitronate monooxygenase